jgi:hypothetical protein
MGLKMWRYELDSSASGNGSLAEGWEFDWLPFKK